MPAFFPPGIVSTTGLVDPGGGADPDGGVEPGPSRAVPGGADSWSPLPSVTFPVQNNTESLYRQCMAELSLQQCTSIHSKITLPVVITTILDRPNLKNPSDGKMLSAQSARQEFNLQKLNFTNKMEKI